MKFFKKHFHIILICSVLPAAIMFFASSALFPSNYESSAVLYVSKPPSVFAPEAMKANADWGSPIITVDNLKRFINDKDVQKEIGLKLLAKHLTLRNTNPDIISAKHFTTFRESIPSDILALAGETDSITYLNLLSQANEHPFLVETILHSDVSYYSNAAIASVNIARIENSDMMTMSYMSRDPGIGQQILNMILEECMRHFNGLNAIRISEIVSYYESRFQNAKNDLLLLDKKLPVNRQIGITQRENILRQLVTEQEKILVSENSIKSIENQINIQNLAVKNQNIAAKLKVLSGLYHQWTKNTVEDPVALQIQIDQAHQELKNEISAIILPLPGDGETKKKVIENYDNALVANEWHKARLIALERQRKELYPSILTPLDLKEIDASDQNYIHVLAELNKSKRYLQNLSAASPMMIIEKPHYKAISGYRGMMWTVLAGFAGLVLSLALIMLRLSLTKKLKTPQRTEQKTGLRVAGIIPNDKHLQAYNNSNHIINSLMYHMLWNFFQTSQKQRRVLVTSIYPEDGKTFVTDMMSDWLISKGKKCKVVTPYFDKGVWWVKSQSVIGHKLEPVESLAEIDVVILKLSPLITGEYPIELIRKFNTTFLVCNADKEWLPHDQKILENFVGHSKQVPQIILNNVNMDVVKDILGKINIVKTYFASDKRSSSRTIRRRHERISSSQQAQQIVKAMPNLGVILDKNRQIVYANDAITSLLGLRSMNNTLGLRPGELVSCIYSDVTDGGCGTSRACQNCGAVNTILKCIRSRKHEEGECRINSFMNGQLVPFNFKISCAPFEANGDFFVVTNLADISGEEDKRKQFIDKAIVNVKSNGDVSALSNLIGNAEESGQLDNLIDTLKQSSSPITEEILESQRLVDAKNGELKVELGTASAFNILDNVVRSVRAQKITQDKDITMAPPFPEVSFLTDAALLEQILRSMLRNAVEAIPIGGIVCIGYEKTKHAITFYVFNEGFIPEDIQSNIFQKKFTTKGKGRGFGTYGMKLLGENFLNAYVGFKSTIESGTRFYITIPL